MTQNDIRGIVTDEDGNPVQNVTVSLFQHNGSTVVHTTTDSNGEYVFDNTQVTGEGPWHVIVRDDDGLGGTSLYLVNSSNDVIEEFSLTTAYDISTAGTSPNTSTSSSDGTPEDILFNRTGDKMYELGRLNAEVMQYALSTGYDITSSTQELTKATEIADPFCISFADYGDKFYEAGINSNGNNRLVEMDLSTSYDVSTASVVNAVDPGYWFRGMSVKLGGDKIHAVTGAGNIIEFTLGSRYDVTTLSFNNSVAGDQNTAEGILWSRDGMTLYVLYESNDDIYSYTVPYPYDLDGISQNNQMSVVDGTRGMAWRRAKEYNAFSKPYVQGTIEADPFFAVTINSTNSPVTEGEVLDVNATIENTGGQKDEQTVVLNVAGADRDQTVDFLVGGDSVTNTYSWQTSSGDAGSYNATVSSNDDSDVWDVNVLTPPFFDVTIDSTNSPVNEGKTLNVNYTVNNTGETDDTQTITLDIDGSQVDSHTGVSVAGGGSHSDTLTWDTSGQSHTTYTATVSSEDDSASQSVEVTSPIPNSATNRWPLAEGSGTTTADTVGSQGATINGSTWSSGTWIENYSLNHDGTDDYINCTSIPELSGSSFIDCSILFTLQTTTGQGVICGIFVGGGQCQRITLGSGRGVNDGEMAIRWDDQDNRQQHFSATGTNFADGAKRRFAITKSGDNPGDTSLYVNGSSYSIANELDQSPYNWQNWNRDWYWMNINDEGNPGTSWMDGYIDDMMICSTDITATEVQDDYNRQPWS